MDEVGSSGTADIIRPAHAEKPQKTPKKKAGIGLLSDIAICLATTFTLAVMHYEHYMPESFALVYNVLLTLVFVSVWSYIPFRNGMKGKWQFMIFDLLCWILPAAVIYLSNSGPEFFRLSLVFFILSGYAEIIFLTPVQVIGGILGVGSYPAIAVIILYSAIAFCIGILYHMHIGKKRRLIR